MIRVRFSRATYLLAAALMTGTLFLFLQPTFTLDTDQFLSETPIDFNLGHGRKFPFSHPHENAKAIPSLIYSPDGYVRGWDATQAFVGKGGRVGRKHQVALNSLRNKHPIMELIERGQTKWEKLLARQSKTLPDAVTEYGRYARPPPRGFKVWFDFCKSNNIKIIDDYDQINRDIEPFLALSPSTFCKRVEGLKGMTHSYQISLFINGEHTLEGSQSHSSRAIGLRDLLSPLATLLPKNLTIYVSDHDQGSQLLGDDLLQAALIAVRSGIYLSPDRLEELEKITRGREVGGIVSACPEGSVAWNTTLAIMRGEEIPDPTPETTFIHDPRSTYNFCHHPTLLNTHGGLSFHQPRPSRLRPSFQLSKQLQNPEFLTTPLEAYENHTSSSAQSKVTPWIEKSINKLFWRGSTTGDSYRLVKNGKEVDWRESHRTALQLLAQGQVKGRGGGEGGEEGEVEEEGGAGEGEEKGVWVQRQGRWVKEMWGMKELSKAYLDVGLMGVPHQCNQEDGTCEEMQSEIIFKDRVFPQEAAKYKYMLDVDGNGWSSRFHRLLLSGSAVVKATIYAEWYSDWLIPWVHYIPCQVDYADLYSILSFFIGSPDEKDPGHDQLARNIAEQGQQFAEEHWRWEDMQGYMFRLLLEYARLMADDRDAWSYTD